MDFGPTMGPDKGSFLGSIGAGVVGRTSKDLMDKSMGKRPVGMVEPIHNNRGLDNNLTTST